jgi:hypothetical protein
MCICAILSVVLRRTKCFKFELLERRIKLEILSSQKRGGQEGYQSIRLNFVHNRRSHNLVHSKTRLQRLWPKKMESFLVWNALPKNRSVAQCRQRTIEFFVAHSTSKDSTFLSPRRCNRLFIFKAQE